MCREVGDFRLNLSAPNNSMTCELFGVVGNLQSGQDNLPIISQPKLSQGKLN
jgi:hypothetical protein